MTDSSCPRPMVYSTDPRNISHCKTYSNSKLAANRVRNTHVLVCRLPPPLQPTTSASDCAADARKSYKQKKKIRTHLYGRLAPGKHLARDFKICATSICLWRLVLPPMADCMLLATVLHPYVFGRPRRIHSFRSPSYYRSTGSYKSNSPHSAI